MSKKTYTDFIPKADAKLRLWLINVLIHLAEVILKLIPSMPVEEREAYEAQIEELIEAIEDVERKKTDLAAAVSRKEEIKKKVIKSMRDLAVRFKRSSRYSEQYIALLGMRCKGTTLDLPELRPSIKATVTSTHVEIHFRKYHILNISIYGRYPGGEWEHLGYDYESPFKDKRPLREEHMPERREYMARFTNFKEDFGQNSAIVSIVYGGFQGA